jgi:hypothetical protein
MPLPVAAAALAAARAAIAYVGRTSVAKGLVHAATRPKLDKLGKFLSQSPRKQMSRLRKSGAPKHVPDELEKFLKMGPKMQQRTMDKLQKAKSAITDNRSLDLLPGGPKHAARKAAQLAQAKTDAVKIAKAAKVAAVPLTVGAGASAYLTREELNERIAALEEPAAPTEKIEKKIIPQPRTTGRS